MFLFMSINNFIMVYLNVIAIIFQHYLMFYKKKKLQLGILIIIQYN